MGKDCVIKRKCARHMSQCRECGEYVWEVSYIESDWRVRYVDY